MDPFRLSAGRLRVRVALPKLLIRAASTLNVDGTVEQMGMAAVARLAIGTCFYFGKEGPPTCQRRVQRDPEVT